MSLVRLLQAGKSLVGGVDANVHYRIGSAGSLPEFGAKKNPFRATAHKPNSRASKAEAAEPKPELAPRSAAKAMEPAAVTLPRAKSAAAKPARKGRWVDWCAIKLSEFLAPRPRPARSAIPRLGSAPVQGELSLDNIRVVRNDLSDGDVEVVRVQAPLKPEAALRPAERAEAAGKSVN